jgi:hypothetical protein
MLLEATFSLIVIGDETPGLNIVRVTPPPPKVTIVPPPIPKITPVPIPKKTIKYIPTKPIPQSPSAKPDATVTKFTPSLPGSGTYKGVNVAQQSETLKKKIKLKPRTKQQEADLVKKLGSK